MKPLVAYGSTMHGSEKVAKHIAGKYGVTARELNDVKIEDLKNTKLAIFVIATFGNGQYPTNCKNFCERLDGTPVDLSHLQFAELALGSRHYQYFCKAGDELHRMLTEKGAKEIIPYVQSDKCEKDYGEGAIEQFKIDAVNFEKAIERNQQQKLEQANLQKQQQHKSGSTIIAYATTMKGSEKIAKGIAEKIGIKAVTLNELTVENLQKANYAIFIVSTFGNGDYPDNGKVFSEDLRNSSASLSNLKYSLLALGSTKYPNYCKAGDDFNQLLTKHGAKAVTETLHSDKISSDGGAGIIEKFVTDSVKLIPAASTDSQKPLIAYATTMKGAEKIAKRISEQIGSEARPLNDLTVEILEKTKYAIFIVSTFGNGEYPDNGGKFAETLRNANTDLSKLKFSLLALGSSKYPNFCKSGDDFFQILTYHNAHPAISFTHSDKNAGDGGSAVIEKFITDSINAIPKDTSDLSFADNKPLVAYGSTMHGSEKIAKNVASKLGTEALELNDVTMEMLGSASIGIFVVGTIGNGHFPKNCQMFADTLSASRVDLSKLQFALLGLGSTYYQLFCNASNNINKQLVDHGAKPLVKYTKSDKAASDQGKSVIEDFEKSVLALKIDSSSQNSIKPLIAYGSTRHGAEKIAKDLATKFGVEAKELNFVQNSDLESAKVAIFVISTTGNGQYPMNCRQFCENFQYSNADLRNLQFTELALGSSYYQYYCKAGDELNKMLIARGAKPLIPYLKSNKAAEDYGEGAIAKFVSDIVSSIGSFQPKTSSKVEINEISEKVGPLCPEGYIDVKISSKELLSVGNYEPRLWKYTVKLPDSVSYVAGDHCYVYPQNDPEVVKQVLAKLGLKPEAAFQITSSGSIILPQKATALQLFSQFVDLNAKPSRQLHDLFGVSQVAPVITAADLILSSTAATVPKLNDILGASSYIEPRAYSIASERKGELDLVIGDVSFNGHPGLCTHYMSLPTTNVIQIQTMKGLFQYPEDPETPIIICALGTGISPVFSLLEHRKTGKFGKCLVFFGTRFENASKKAVDMLEEYQKQGAITKLCVAVSREGKKQHIQSVIQEEEDAIWDLWKDEKAQIFYCGPPNSACDEIREILVKLALNKAKMTRTEAVWHCSHHKWCIEQF